MSFIEDFPHTSVYDKDLGWLIRKYKELNDNYELLKDIYNIVKEQINDVTIEQLKEWLNDGTLETLINTNILGNITTRVSTIENALNNKAYVLKPTDNITSLIAQGITNFELIANEEYVFSNITVPNNFSIDGKGAVIKNGGDCVFKLIGVNNIRISNVYFYGKYDTSNNQPIDIRDNIIEVIQSNIIYISNCTFRNVRGTAISCHDMQESYYRENCYITNNNFLWCYVGVSFYDNYEYSVIETNSFIYCRIACWLQSGNISVTNNIFSKCRGSIIFTFELTSFITTQGSNGGHGIVSGNIINHSTKGEAIEVGWAKSNYLINTKDYLGVYIDGANEMIPPLLTNNCLFYTDISYVNSIVNLSKWIIESCYLSNNAIKCDKFGKIMIKNCLVYREINVTNTLPTPTTEISLKNGTTKVTPALCWIDDDSMTHLSGTVNITASGVIGNIPTTHAPYEYSWFTPIYTSGNVAKCKIDKEGNITVTGVESGSISFDNIVFPSRHRGTYL